MLRQKIASTDTTDRLPYSDREVDRSIASINGFFMSLDDRGPIVAAIDIARRQGGVSLLDAGCGTGKALIELKDQISFRAPVPEESIEALGVSLADYTYAFGGNFTERAHLSDGYVTMALGNLASISLRPAHYDVAYSYEVLMHNYALRPLLTNVTASIRPGGVYYFNALEEQVGVIEDFAHSQDVSLESVVVTGREPGRSATRAFFKLTKF